MSDLNLETVKSQNDQNQKPNNTGFLIETIMPAESELKVLQESHSFIEGLPPQKFFYLQGIFLEGDIRNANGRIYPKKEIESAVKELQARIDTYGPVAGQLDHPNHMGFDFLETAVAIIKVDMQGSNGVGKMRVVPEGRGKIVEGVLKAGIRVGVSSRGQGDVDANGIVSNFKIVTIDVVLNPSAPHAYPTATLAESIEKYRNGRELLNIADASVHDPAANKYLERSLKQFVEQIKEEYSTWRKSK